MALAEGVPLTISRMPARGSGSISINLPLHPPLHPLHPPFSNTVISGGAQFRGIAALISLLSPFEACYSSIRILIEGSAATMETKMGRISREARARRQTNAHLINLGRQMNMLSAASIGRAIGVEPIRLQAYARQQAVLKEDEERQLEEHLRDVKVAEAFMRKRQRLGIVTPVEEEALQSPEVQIGRIREFMAQQTGKTPEDVTVSVHPRVLVVICPL